MFDRFSRSVVVISEYTIGRKRVRAMRNSTVVFCVAVSLGLTGGVATAQTAGAPDGGFGQHGVVLTSLPASQVGAVAVQADGKIVLATTQVPQGPGLSALIRLLPGGGLDTSFGVNGVATLAVPGVTASVAPSALTLQANGDIIVTGSSFYAPRDGGPSFVARFLPNGAPDAGFGGGGYVQNPVPGPDVTLVDADGDLLVAGGDDQADQSAVAKLTPSGALDKRYGLSGISLFDGLVGRITALALQQSNKLFVVGSGGAFRLTANGRLDTGMAGRSRSTPTPGTPSPASIAISTLSPIAICARTSSTRTSGAVFRCRFG
jgi:uncharacterized delta-60 repeat protein